MSNYNEEEDKALTPDELLKVEEKVQDWWAANTPSNTEVRPESFGKGWIRLLNRFAADEPYACREDIMGHLNIWGARYENAKETVENLEAVESEEMNLDDDDDDDDGTEDWEAEEGATSHGETEGGDATTGSELLKSLKSAREPLRYIYAMLSGRSSCPKTYSGARDATHGLQISGVFKSRVESQYVNRRRNCHSSLRCIPPTQRCNPVDGFLLQKTTPIDSGIPQAEEACDIPRVLAGYRPLNNQTVQRELGLPQGARVTAGS
ncbi:uncharacterized protein EV422DRAFT_509362 [Fimicolochytrium jonesii]|uniref:uncharacterized protein n=1 Tax=Fimicolochytrium jonesii TaxID=1396493 RepID=UPI0022FDD290|nr:uncharacterized protein EV422DRAFT_509362 [Fimicolochytrium jonesii]KAI8816931.1 hypothetical protein EV422DRAFT_509362 [Fimicolochytrium jonesii]